MSLMTNETWETSDKSGEESAEEDDVATATDESHENSDEDGRSELTALSLQPLLLQSNSNARIVSPGSTELLPKRRKDQKRKKNAGIVTVSRSGGRRTRTQKQSTANVVEQPAPTSQQEAFAEVDLSDSVPSPQNTSRLKRYLRTGGKKLHGCYRFFCPTLFNEDWRKEFYIGIRLLVLQLLLLLFATLTLFCIAYVNVQNGTVGSIEYLQSYFDSASERLHLARNESAEEATRRKIAHQANMAVLANTSNIALQFARGFAIVASVFALANAVHAINYETRKVKRALFCLILLAWAVTTAVKAFEQSADFEFGHKTQEFIEDVDAALNEPDPYDELETDLPQSPSPHSSPGEYAPPAVDLDASTSSYVYFAYNKMLGVFGPTGTAAIFFLLCTVNLVRESG